MKTKLLSLTAFVFAITSSFGQLVLHEPFNYVEGATLTGQMLGSATWANFSGGTPDDMLITAQPAWTTFTGLPSAATGKAVAWQGGGSDLSLPFAEINSGTVYFSFLINIIDWAGATPDAYRLVSLSIPSSTNVGPSFYTKAGATPDTFNIGYAPADTASEAVYTTTDYAYGGTQFFIVISYEIGTSMGKMWVNPVASTTEPTATLSTNVTAKPRSAFDDFQLQASSNARTPSSVIDEVRIGKSWADVVAQTASVSSFENNSVNLYPNPAKNTLYVDSKDAIDSVSIYSMDGKVVLSQNASNNNTIDISNLSSGLYVVKISSNEKVITKKIIIE